MEREVTHGPDQFAGLPEATSNLDLKPFIEDSGNPLLVCGCDDAPVAAGAQGAKAKGGKPRGSSGHAWQK